MPIRYNQKNAKVMDLGVTETLLKYTDQYL